MTKGEVLEKLESMNDDEFNEFLRKCPERVQMLVRSGMCNWRVVLPQWYRKIINDKKKHDDY